MLKTMNKVVANLPIGMQLSSTEEYTSNIYNINKSHRHNIEWNQHETKIVSTT